MKGFKIVLFVLWLLAVVGAVIGMGVGKGTWISWFWFVCTILLMVVPWLIKLWSGDYEG